MSQHWRVCSVQWNDVPAVYGQSIANAREGCQAQKDLPGSFHIFVRRGPIYRAPWVGKGGILFIKHTLALIRLEVVI